MNRPAIIVSACLLGERCRYDGSSKNSTDLSLILENYNVIPFCPEDPLFGTPRERISVMKIEGKHRVVVAQSGEDVTDRLSAYIEEFLKENSSVKLALLKSKSPSCGYRTTPILDENFNQISLENGIAAQIFEEAGIAVCDELNFSTTLI